MAAISEADAFVFNQAFCFFTASLLSLGSVEYRNSYGRTIEMRFFVVCDRDAALQRRWCVSHFEIVLGVRVTLLNAFLLVEIIYAGLESSTRLNSSAYVCAYTRAKLYAGSMNGSGYALICARIRTYMCAQSMNPALRSLLIWGLIDFDLQFHL